MRRARVWPSILLAVGSLSACQARLHRQASVPPAARPVSYADGLRSILQLCPHLLRIDGMAPWLEPCEEDEGRACRASANPGFIALSDVEVGNGREGIWRSRILIVARHSCEVSAASTRGWNSALFVIADWSRSSAGSPLGPWWPVPSAIAPPVRTDVLQSPVPDRACDELPLLVARTRVAVGPYRGRLDSLPAYEHEIQQGERLPGLEPRRLPLRGSKTFIPAQRLTWGVAGPRRNLGFTPARRGCGQALAVYDEASNSTTWCWIRETRPEGRTCGSSASRGTSSSSPRPMISPGKRASRQWIYGGETSDS